MDEILTTAIGIKIFQQEIRNTSYRAPLNVYQQETETYICMYVRRSWCNEERMMRKLEAHCGGTPSYIGGTDCVCLWGGLFLYLYN